VSVGLTVHVSGSLVEIKAKLLLLKQIIAQCEVEGFDGFDIEFLYRYNSVNDSVVCEDCLPHHGNTYNGGYVQGEFPKVTQIPKQALDTGGGGNSLYPNVHSDEFTCRCNLDLINAGEACANLLSKKMLVIT